MSTGLEIPDKRYFKIGEVSALIEVEPYVLRYWENEFASIRPVRAPNGQRLYRKIDVETVVKIKHLLYEKKIHDRRCKKGTSIKHKAPRKACGSGFSRRNKIRPSFHQEYPQIASS
jgi:hypothetical protein